MTHQATDNQRKKKEATNKTSFFFWTAAYYRRKTFKKVYIDKDSNNYIFKSIPAQISAPLSENEYNRHPLWNSEHLINMIMNDDYSYCLSLETCGIGKDVYINKNDTGTYNIILNLHSIREDNANLEDIEYAMSISEFRINLAKSYLNHIKYNTDYSLFKDEISKIAINRYKSTEGAVVKDEIPRALGLWMWDQINLWKTCKTYKDAINKLFDLKIDNKHVITEINYTDINNTTLERFIRATNKCIENKKILAFIDKKCD